MDTTSLEVIEQKDEVKSLVKNAQSARNYADALVIKTDKHQEAAVAAGMKIKEEYNRGKLLLDLIVGPIKKHIKSLEGIFMPRLDDLKYAENTIKNKLASYQLEIEKKAEAAKAKAIKDLEDGKIKNVENAVKKIENVKQPEKTIRQDSGTVTFREVKDVEIEDESKLPREYLIPDAVKIRKMALAGVEIPGVKVITKKVPSFRSNAY